MSSIKSCLITRGFCDLEYPTGKARLNAWSVSFFVTLLGVMAGVGLLVHAAMTNGGRIDFTSLQSRMGVSITSLSAIGFAIVMVRSCRLQDSRAPALPRGVQLPPGYEWNQHLNNFYPRGTTVYINEDNWFAEISDSEKERLKAFHEEISTWH